MLSTLLVQFCVMSTANVFAIELGNPFIMNQLYRNHTFQGVFHHNLKSPLKIIWLKDGDDISQCIPDMGCIDTNEEETSTSLRHLGNKMYEFTLFINNVTEKDAGLWSLEYFGEANEEYPKPIFQCQLNLEDMQCVLPSEPTSSREMHYITSTGPYAEKMESNTAMIYYILIPALVGVVLSVFIAVIVCQNKPQKDGAHKVAFKIRLFLASLIIGKPRITSVTEKYSNDSPSAPLTDV